MSFLKTEDASRIIVIFLGVAYVVFWMMSGRPYFLIPLLNWFYPSVSESYGGGLLTPLLDGGATMLFWLALSHAVFWPTIRYPEKTWPRWGKPALRAVDYLWYSGAVVGLLYVVSEGQLRDTQRLASLLNENIEREERMLAGDRQFVVDVCKHFYSWPAPENDYPEGFFEIYDVSATVCDGVLKHNIANFVGPNVYEKCDEFERVKPFLFDSVFPADSSGVQYIPRDLPARYGGLSLFVERMIAICDGRTNLWEWRDQLGELRPLEEIGEKAVISRFSPTVIVWFSALIGFRLARTTAEFFGALRDSRNSKR